MLKNWLNEEYLCGFCLISFLIGDYYYVGVWKSNIISFYDVIVYLIGCYVIDLDYGIKLNLLINIYNLICFDILLIGLVIIIIISIIIIIIMMILMLLLLLIIGMDINSS